MNEVLQLRGHLSSRPYPSKPGTPQLPVNVSVSSCKLKELAKQLSKIKSDWNNGYVTQKVLVSVHYQRVIPKSRRMQVILSEHDGTSDQTVVGAMFDDGPRHVITHCVSKQAIDASISLLTKAANALELDFDSRINKETLAQINAEDHRKQSSEILGNHGLSRSRFTRVVVDVAFVDRFEIDEDAPDYNGEAIVSFYDTGESLRSIFAKLDIPYRVGKTLDESTVIMSPDDYRMVKERAPYLISMSADVVDWGAREPDELNEMQFYGRQIRPPTNEPTVGVIDTLFKKNKEQVYFSDWVEYHEMVDSRIPRTSESYIHGTKVSSIIVDGPSLNPLLDDGCGHFKVRHFGVATEKRFSLITVLRSIEGIVASNPDIRVWNLSLGSPLAVPKNSISPMAALLDRIQSEKNVIFVIAGTNDTAHTGETIRIGSPADSINGIVVNSVRRDGSPASYSRRGPVLSFFNKPDVSYYGGDDNEQLVAYAPGGESYARGTSYAAPWITRKLAYLIHVMGLSKECAKALIIDSALGWASKPQSLVSGHGIVPIHINDIVKCRDDEIKFILHASSTQYDTYSYRIPVPTNKGKQPYYVKATMCYSPSCSRKQGVDYTNTELDLKIGRLHNGSLKPINNDMQGEAGHYLYEKEARRLFRKWDNVKYVGESIKQRQVPKKIYHTTNWGISVQAKQRLSTTIRENVDFGIVVTLREMNGVNRINEFIRSCEMYEWRVSKLDVRISEEIFTLAEEEVEFDD